MRRAHAGRVHEVAEAATERHLSDGADELHPGGGGGLGGFPIDGGHGVERHRLPVPAEVLETLLAVDVHLGTDAGGRPAAGTSGGDDCPVRKHFDEPDGGW